MRIANNIAALRTANVLKKANTATSKSMDKLASGLRIDSAGDDAAGLSISEKMRGQIRGLNMAGKNVMDGISLIQTAEGALNEQHAILQRMRELSVQAANDTNALPDRQAISTEVSRLIEELDSIVQNTQFNTKHLFLGLDATPVTVQMGANQGDDLDILIKKSTIPSFGYFAWEAPTVIIGGPGAEQIVDLSTNESASVFLTAVEKGIEDVSAVRASLGGYQNRLEHTYANLTNTSENLSAAESRIRDADMAREMVDLVKSQILQQSGTAMLAQANQLPKNILGLISG